MDKVTGTEVVTSGILLGMLELLVKVGNTATVLAGGLTGDCEVATETR